MIWHRIIFALPPSWGKVNRALRVVQQVAERGLVEPPPHPALRVTYPREGGKGIHPSHESGFTLLEIMVGLVISSLIMVGLTSVMQVVNTGWSRTTVSIEKQSALTAGLEILAADVARIERIVSKDRKSFLFGGSPAEAVYILAERDSHNEAGLYWVRLLARSKDGITELVRMRAPRILGENDISRISWRDEVVLLRGRYGIEMSYRAPPAEAEWSRYWDGKSRLPRQIRFIITGADGKPAVPEMVLALKIGAESACFAASTAGCTLSTGGELVNQEEPAQ